MGWQLDEFYVEAFRGLRDLRLAGMGQVTLLVGPNDAGKTSVLEALSLFCSPHDPSTWIRASRLRDRGRLIRASTIGRLRYLFPQVAAGGEQSLGAIRMAGQGRHPVGTVSARFSETARMGVGSRRRRESAADEEGLQRGLRIEVVVEPARQPGLFPPEVIHLDFFDDEIIKVEQREIVPFQYVAPHDISPAASVFSRLRESGHDEPVVDLLREFDSRVVEVQVLEPSGFPELYIRDRISGWLPVRVYGEGLQRALLFAMRITRAAGGVVVIDEIEAALHKTALTRVFRWLVEMSRAYSVQLVLTTHSLEAVDAILDADMTPEEDVVGYRLDRSGAASQAKRYGEDMLKRLRRDRGLDVR